MSVESAVKRLFEDFNMSRYGMIEIKQHEGYCTGEKCKLGGMVESEDLSDFELDLMVELLLRVKSIMGDKVRRISLFNRAGNREYVKFSYVENNGVVTIVIV